MKREIADYVSRCLTCQQVKAEHQRPAGLLQPLQIPEWKWEHITMDFVVGLPATQKGHNGVWVIVDKLTKTAHFLPFNTRWSVAKLARYYVREIVRFRNRLYMPSTARQELCDEAHRSKLSIHLRGNKMYQNMKRHFWWQT